MGAATELLKKFLAGLLRIQPGEGPKTALMFGALMCVVGFFITGRVARDSLFLSRYSIDYLPYIYIWVALGVSLLSYLYSRVADRLRRDQSLSYALLLVLACTLAARIALFWVGDWFYPVLYVFVELAGTLLIIQVWTLANDVFTTREAKRLFGLVGAGGVVSAVVVGFSVRALVKSIGTENLLFLCALALAMGLLLVTRISRTCRDEILSNLTERPRSVRARIALLADWRRFFTSRHLVYVAGLIVALGFVMTLVDYHFKITARAAYLDQEEQLAGFFGLFWALTGALNCVIQFFVTGRVLERFGILVALLILPLSLLLGSIAILAVPALWSATLLKGGDAVFRYTVNDATVQLLYLPVPAQFRGRAKAFIDGIMRPVAIGTAGVILAWVLPALHPGALGWILVTFIIAWVLFAVGARKQYYRSLMSTLQRRRLHFGDVGDILPDQAASRVLRRALQNPDEQAILHALDMLPYCNGVDLGDELTRLVKHPAAPIRTRVLQLLGRNGDLKHGPFVFERLHDHDPVVRAAAVEAYSAIGKNRAIRAVGRFLQDGSTEVRAAAVVGMMRYGGLDGILSSAEQLKGMLRSEEPSERATGARILGDIGVKNFYHPLLALMVDPVPEVQTAAIRSAGQMKSNELLPALIYRLEDPSTRGAASKSLVAFGDEAVKLLGRVLANTSEAHPTRLAVPSILARIGSQESLDILARHLKDLDENLRSRVLEGIHRIRLRRPHRTVPADTVQQALRYEIRHLYRQWIFFGKLDCARENQLLFEALDRRRETTLQRIFRLLGCLYPVRTIDAVYVNLSAPARIIRANAVEVLDNLLDKETKKLLLPLLDESNDPRRKAAVGNELFPEDPGNQLDCLRELMKDNLGWLTSCALFASSQVGDRDLVEQVRACTEFDSPLVRETALFALSRLLPPAELRNAIHQHARDPANNVRNYASWLLTDPGPAS